MNPLIYWFYGHITIFSCSSLKLEHSSLSSLLNNLSSIPLLTGWTSRQQFEETWMSLLGVLNPVSLPDEEDQHQPSIEV